MSREFQVTVDCADPEALATFWAAALDYVVQPPPEGFESWPAALTAFGVPAERQGDAHAVVDPDGRGPRLFFQRVPEAKRVKNRVHLDLRAAPDAGPEDRMAALEVEAERLVALGATRRRRVEPDPPLVGGFLVMSDPEGNEFCLD
ncbi:VOC family protein [Kineococcus gynurae]|uniref:VOC family protein n=1 Tax=Kineococcus gynurae TaxID=452979 RepID=A0ABV5LPD2_9ACTN